MKAFIFMYPTREHFEAWYTVGFYRDQHDITYLLKIIDRRYRQEGYQVVWVHFSLDDQPCLPDVDVPDWFRSDPSDRHIASGVSRRRQQLFWEYAPLEYLFGHIHQPMTDIHEIIVGGFLWGDCVSRVAEYGYHKNIPSRVDLDVTDQFFHIMAAGGCPIPLKREQLSYLDPNVSLHSLKSGSSNRRSTLEEYQDCREVVQEKPWLPWPRANRELLRELARRRPVPLSPIGTVV